MDYIFDYTILIFSFCITVFCYVLTFAAAWVPAFLAIALAIFVVYLPAVFVLNELANKYEKMLKLYNLVSGRGEMICAFSMVAAGVLCIPILILGPTKAANAVKEKMSQSAAQEIIIGTEVRQFKLLELSSPKHVYANFEDVNTNVVYSQMYVGTYCPGKTVRIGEKYNIKVVRIVRK